MGVCDNISKEFSEFIYKKEATEKLKENSLEGPMLAIFKDLNSFLGDKSFLVEKLSIADLYAVCTMEIIHQSCIAVGAESIPYRFDNLRRLRSNVTNLEGVKGRVEEEWKKTPWLL